MNVKPIISELIIFRDDRDWQKFHTGQELARALTIEATELNRLFQWGNEPATPEELENLKDEIGDVRIYLEYIAERYNIDTTEAMIQKIPKNAIKYPVKP